jgi:hypothetical protein
MCFLDGFSKELKIYEDGCLLGCTAMWSGRRFTNVSEVLAASIKFLSRTSETLVNFYQTTRRYNPQDSHLCTHRCVNLKFCRKFMGLNIFWFQGDMFKDVTAILKM